MGSPPKPWERNAGIASASQPTVAATTPSAASSSSIPPTIPERPAAFSSAPMMSSYSSPYSRMGTSYGAGYGTGYGTAGFGSIGYGAGSYGTGYGGYGGGMGYGMGGMSYGMSGYGGGMGMGMPGYPGVDPNGNHLSSTTEHTFALLHSVVQTFSGVAQMLESTFMATHSSFFAMVGVVEQLGHLRDVLGSILGLFGLVRWLKDLLTGNLHRNTNHEFRQFINGQPVQGPRPPKPSKKPLIIFLLAIFGVPYAMTKLMRILNERAAKDGVVAGPAGPLDPSSLTFARALYPFNASTPTELTLKQEDIVAIIAKLDPSTGTEVDPRMEVDGGEWWKGRTRDGRQGWFPRKWVQIIERPAAKVKEIE
ncbi:Peroxin 13, N-terminal region-domain-containing protein [Mycena floridula]|nr:Peroxin 13, N-terminal region-domain-containing protein [Mycena floridula]